MKKFFLASATIVGLAGIAAAAALTVLPAASVGALTAWGLTTAFFTVGIGTGVLFAGHFRPNQSADVSLAGGATAFAAMAACAVMNLGAGPAQAATPQARHAFAESTTRPCPRPGQGDFIPLTENCRAQARTAPQG